MADLFDYMPVKYERGDDGGAYKIQMKSAAKDKFKELRAAGENVICPCCGVEHNILYKRNLYKSMVKALVSFAQGAKNIHAASVGDFTKLAHWGMVESTDLPGKGAWRLTQRGADFINGNISVPKSVFLCNNIVKGWSENMVKITDILGEA